MCFLSISISKKIRTPEQKLGKPEQERIENSSALENAISTQSKDLLKDCEQTSVLNANMSSPSPKIHQREIRGYEVWPADKVIFRIIV